MKRIIEQRTRELRRLATGLIVGNCVLAATLTTVAALTLDASWHAYELRAESAARNIASSTALLVESEIRQVDTALRSAELEFQAREKEGRSSQTVLDRALRQQQALHPELAAVRMSDAAGLVRFGLDGGHTGINIADRDYFSAARESGHLVISEPQVGRINQHWGIALARAIHAQNGTFVGVAYASLAADYFIDHFKAFSLGGSGAVSLRSPSLHLIARYTPAGEPPLNPSTANVSREFEAALRTNPDAGVFVSTTAVDGIRRVSAYQRIPGYELLVLGGLSTHEYFDAWRTEATQVTLVSILMMMLHGTLSVLYFKYSKRRFLSEVETLQDALEKSAMLDNELVGMVRLKGRTALWTNRAFESMFGYDTGALFGKDARILYPDEESYERIGREAYPALNAGKRFRAQLQLKRKDASMIWVDLAGVTVSDQETLWTMVDITAIKASEESAHHVARHDSLTGLPNRVVFERAVDEACQHQGDHDFHSAVLFLDVDQFKSVNDGYGHAVGDEVLKELAQRLSAAVRPTDLVARLAGDEFVVLLRNLHRGEEAQFVARKILRVIAEPWKVGDLHLSVAVSVGIAVTEPDVIDASTLLRRADAALYEAKAAGRNTFRVAR